MTCGRLFTLSSLLCGLSTSLGMLIFFRIIQGAAAEPPARSEQAILRRQLPAGANEAWAHVRMAVVFGPSIGPTLGGWDHRQLQLALESSSSTCRWESFSLYLTERLVEDPARGLADAPGARQA